MTATFHVAVGSFEGPFDLLLQLVARHKVDIYDIPIAQITDDYLAVLRTLDDIDLEVATEFLVVAATLLELKAARLLPGEDDPEMEELALEARDLLYARLLDYRAFKEAAAFLAGRWDEQRGYWPRLVELEGPFTGLIPDVELPVGPEQLAALAAQALRERPQPVVDVSHLQPVRMTVREAAALIADELDRAGGRASFRELTAGCRHRIEVVTCFLALLELFKLDQVELEQEAEAFGDLTVSWTDRANWDGSSLAAMEIYEAEPLAEIEEEPS